MNETLSKCRNMFANNRMATLISETRKLIDEFGVVGAEIYLQAQLVTLREMAALDAERRGDDDEF